MLDVLFKPRMDRLWAPLGKLAASVGLTPNSVTYLSVALCALNAYAYTVHRNAAAFAAGLLLFEALDNVDGALARATNRCTDFGAYLDAVTDRYKDALAVVAVGVVTGLWLACGALLSGAFMVSYTQARAQAQGAPAALGGVLPMFERLERILTLAAGLLVAHCVAASQTETVLNVTLWASAAFTHATALQRIAGAARALRGLHPAAPAPPPTAPTGCGEARALPEPSCENIASATALRAYAQAVALHTPSDKELAQRCYTQSKGDTEWRGDWPAYVLFRPVSFALTPLALACRISATQITLLCALLASALPAIAWLVDLRRACFGIGLCGALFQLLDCLDGNVARVRGTVSARGDYLSMLVGQWYWVMLLTAFGLAAARADAGVLAAQGALSGAGLGALVVLGRLCREYTTARRGAQTDALTAGENLGGWLRQARLFGSGLDNLIFAGVPLAGALQVLPGAFWATGVYVTGVFAVTQYECWQALRA